MPHKKRITHKSGLYFITFTCFQWRPLIEISGAYSSVYKWFDQLKLQGHRLSAFAIMPNHIHVLIHFAESEKSINTIVGDGKRFIAYEIVNSLESKNDWKLLNQLRKAVAPRNARKNQRHIVWKESFDWKRCETRPFAYQKLVYINANPCKGKWKLAKDVSAYEHCSARFYICGRHAAYKVVDVDTILMEMNRERVLR